MKIVLVTAAAWLLMLAPPVRAEAPVALVEDLSGKPPGIEFMDYVVPGRVVVLGPQDSIVLGYIRSCWRETIRGGIVTIGSAQSDVKGGSVSRVKVACDGGRMELAAEQSRQSVTMVFRDTANKPRRTTLPKPQFVLHGRSPVIELRGGGTVVFERLDSSGDRLEVVITPAKMMRGAFYDLAGAGKALAPGGLYLARTTGQQIVFLVDAAAAEGKAPLAGRLLRFQPPG